MTDAPPRKSAWWRFVRASMVFAAGLTLVVVAAVAFLVGPSLRDDVILDGVVRAVVLDWRDFGLARAQERLAYELDARHIGEQVGDESCLFRQGDDGDFAVSCDWSAYIDLPWLKQPIVLTFSSAATLGADGSLR